MSDLIKTARGTIDYDPSLLKRLTYITQVIRQNALLLGAEEIDTPMMELTSFLLKKYGQEAEQKLIYRLAQQEENSEDLSLRYDLTVPFQRYLESRSIERIKRFQTGKVFRRDNPNPSRGRLREFLQADLDIVGDWGGEMISEAEVMKLITQSMQQLGFPETSYCIRINFRDNLANLIKQAGISSRLFKSVCISIDKLDKMSWAEVSAELSAKGISEESIAKLQELITTNYCDPQVQPALNQLRELGEIFQYNQQLKFDASLARGLDYYTGLIYEVVVTDAKYAFSQPDEDEEGPIVVTPTLIAGGRYDKLIKFQGKKYLPAIGVSFGINRIEMSLRNNFPLQPIPFRVYVVSQPEFFKTKLMIVNFLRERGIQTEYFENRPRKNIKQINDAIKNNYQYVLIFGENEDQINVKRNDQSVDRLLPLKDLEQLPEYLSINPFTVQQT